MSFTHWLSDNLGLSSRTPGQPTQCGGNRPVTIGGSHTARRFEVAPGAHVTLSELVITGGNGQGGNSSYRYGGGGILNFGTLTVSGSTVSGNSSPNYAGGGV